MYDFYHICVVSFIIHSRKNFRSAAEWSALGSWKCSCFGNRGDWSFWDVMVSLEVFGNIIFVSSQDFEVSQTHWVFGPRKLVFIFFQKCKVVYFFHHLSVLFIVFGGCSHVRVIFAISICFDMFCLSNRFIFFREAEVHIGLGPQVQSGKCLGYVLHH